MLALRLAINAQRHIRQCSKPGWLNGASTVGAYSVGSGVYAFKRLMDLSEQLPGVLGDGTSPLVLKKGIGIIGLIACHPGALQYQVSRADSFIPAGEFVKLMPQTLLLIKQPLMQFFYWKSRLLWCLGHRSITFLWLK